MRGRERQLQHELPCREHRCGCSLGDSPAERVKAHHTVGEGIPDAPPAGQGTRREDGGYQGGAYDHESCRGFIETDCGCERGEHPGKQQKQQVALADLQPV